MKLDINDLKQIQVGGMPLIDWLPLAIKDVKQDDYIVFLYAWDDKSFNITECKRVKLVKEITQQLWRDRPTYKSGSFELPLDVGFFKAPFDSQNALFYMFLKYYIVQQTEGRNLKDFQELMAYFKSVDIEDNRQNPNELNCSFPTYTRAEFETALDKYVLSEKIVVNDILLVTDLIDQYSKSRIKTSFYGGLCKKVVTAVRNPNGGLLLEEGGNIDYLYVGEKSTLVKGDKEIQDKLNVAKAMYRSKQPLGKIFIQTGWAFNTYDSKWRYRITDSNAKLVKTKDIYLGSNNPLANEAQTILQNMVSKSSGQFLPDYIQRGWNVVLGDILQHPLLFQHYPELYRMPVFYGVTDDEKYSFYYNDSDGYINLVGNPNNFDLLTVLLHETQHAIQYIEGFGTGGNQTLAQLIQGLGGSNFREYLFTQKKIQDNYKKGTINQYSYERYITFLNQQPKFRKAVENLRATKDQTEYLKNINQVSFYMIQGYAQGFFQGTQTSLEAYLGADMWELFNEVKEFLYKGSKAVQRLTATGYSQSDINTIIFKSYESLAGEIESRDIQHSYSMTEEEASYLLPYTTETIQEKDVTVIVDDYLKDDMIGVGKIKGGCERASDGKYILHFFASVSPEPILHEISHILMPLLSLNLDKFIEANIPTEQINKLGGVKEAFSELMMCYLVKKKLSQTLTDELEAGRTLMNYNFLDENFDQVFLPEVTEVVERYKEFLTKLKDIVNG